MSAMCGASAVRFEREILHREHEPYRSSVLACQPITFQRERSVLSPVVAHVSDDLDREDLVRSPQHLVNRLPILAGCHLEADSPRRMSFPGKILRNRELSSVA